MNDSDIIINSINSRYSCRKFTKEKISKEDLDTILKSGFCAPSACNLQPWHFIAIDDKDTLNDMTNVHEYASMFNSATAGIIVCGDMDKTIKGHEDFWCQDCSAATQNILLASHALGIGSVWCGIYPVRTRCEYLSNYFNLPENILPFSLIALGKPDSKANIQDKFDSKKVHYNKW